MSSIRSSLLWGILSQIFIVGLIGLLAGELTPSAFILMLILVVGVFIYIQKSLTTLKKLAEAVQSKNNFSLKPIEAASFPDEVSSLILAFNRLSKEYKASIEREKRYRSENVHKLRGALSVLKIHADNAIHLNDPIKKETSLQKLKEGVDRSTRLVEQLRNEVEVEDRSGCSTMEEVDLKKLVHQVLLEMAPRALEKDHQVSFDTEGEIFLIQGEQASLSLLVGNLLQNAIQSMSSGGVLGVRVDEGGSRIVLKISDTGCGVPAELREQIFERFYRLKENKTTGAGLGLSIVKHVANAHAANITMKAPPNHRGLLVSVSFPKIVSGVSNLR